MKRIIKNYFVLISIIIISGFFYCEAYSQVTAKRLEPGEAGMHAALVEYNTLSAPKFEKGKIPVISENGSITSLSDMILINSQKDELGFEHYRYQQTYKGIPIENAIVAVHVKDGKVLFQNGKLVKTLPEQLSTPSISSKTAIASALNNIKAKQYAWENTAAEAQLKKDKKDSKATYYPKGDLVWYSTDGGLDPSKLKLAYKLDVVATDPYIHQLVYVDANNENILGINEIGVKYIGAVGKAHTVYSGIQTINTDLWKVNIDDGVEDFRLFDQTRGNGIQTLNGINESYKYVWLGRRPTGIQLISNAKEYIDHDNDWDNINNDLEQYAADAHWGAEKAFDYYKTKFNFTRIGSNNNPFRVVANIDFGGDANAFWDHDANGIFLSKGGGGSQGQKFGPLVSLDIIGHEITHSITENTSNLGYASTPATIEAGILNEGFSDLFGNCIKFYAKNRLVWTVGEDCGGVQKRFDQPDILQTPSSYKGKFWYVMADPSDKFEQSKVVHYNSSVLTHWFYLLTVGGSGVNDNGCAYDIQGIGIEKAERIAFYTNAYFLTNTSDFVETQRISSLVAQLLYGYGSNEMIQTINAWQAIGLGLSVSYFPDAYSYCSGLAIKVNYLGFCVNKGNSYTLQISDANGNFANATNIGTLKSDAGSGTIIGNTPINFPAGKNYKFRVTTSAPFTISEADKSSIEIKDKGPEPTITASSNTICSLYGINSSTLTAFSTDAQDKFLWSPVAGTKQQIVVNKAGTYSVSVLHRDGCQNSSSKTISPCVSRCLFCTETDQAKEGIGINTNNAVIYPNPVTNGKAIISVSIKKGLINNNEKAKLILYDIMGKEVISYNLQNRNNSIQGEISTTGLAKGTYVYSVSSSAIKNIVKGKIVVQ